jgi:hypothetical protein
MELTAFDGRWTYLRTAANGSGMQVDPTGLSSNAAPPVSANNGAVAFRSDFPILADAWVQVTLGPQQPIATGLALILRADAASSWLCLAIYGSGYAGLMASNAGANALGPVNTASTTGVVYTAGDIVRLELQGTTVRCLRALSTDPTNFQPLWTPGTWNGSGNTFLAATAAGGRAGVAAFMGAATQSWFTAFSAGDFSITGPPTVLMYTG